MSIHPAAGPKGVWLLGNLPERMRDPLGLYLRSQAEFGDVFRLWLGVREVFVVTHPDGIRQVLIDGAADFGKGQLADRLAPFVGRGLLTAEGEHWRRNRRVMQPAFHQERLASFVEGMVEASGRAVDSWLASGPEAELDLAAEMMRLTLGIAGRSLFGTDLTGEASRLSEAFTVAIAGINRRLLLPKVLVDWLPTPGHRAYRRALRVLDEIILGIIARRRREGGGGDLLSMLMGVRDAETGEGMSDRELRDEVLTLLFAGHETTASALSWTWYLLARNPPIEEALRKELGEVLAGRPPAVGDLPRLDYTQRVIEEAMRLYPPAWAIPRTTLREVEIGGVRIPPGVAVVVCSYVTHRRPDLWPDPEVFDPGRFTPAGKEGRPRHAYLPFGAGQRMCIGNHFAMMEAKAVLATVLQRVRFRLADPLASVTPEARLTLRPREGIRVRLQAVAGSSIHGP